jgi:catechol 2,3-dioxygenase-like lactoylglutathione lyase family enzyme
MKRLLFALSILLVPVCSRAADPPARPKIFGIAFVRLKSTHLDSSADFYSRTLGLRSGVDTCKNLPNCFSVNPYQHVELMRADGSVRGSFLEEIGFTTDVPKMREYLFAHGTNPTEVTRGANGLRFFEVKDPDGNQIAFIESSGNDAQVNGSNQISNRLFHAGFVVKDMAAENRFYVDLLGFKLYWYGGFKDDGVDWYEIQVPDGDNWIEYMLNVPATADHKQMGAQNHFSFGVPEIQAAAEQLRKNGAEKIAGPGIGRDGKRGLNVYDPDDTRVEVTEFTPAREPCCHPYTAPHPTP